VPPAEGRREGTVDARDQHSEGVLEVKGPGPERGEIHLRAGDTLRVGRGATNDLVLEDVLVSRFHAAFNASASGVVLSDFSSLNGTFLNGRRITTPVQLRPGDVVTIGDTEIVVHPGTRRGDEDDAEMPSRIASEGTMMAGMKRVVVTVLLADVCSFTKFSEQLPPDDVASMLQLWFGRVSEAVEEFGGEVDKYIGDCVMALWWGVRRDAQDPASHAARAALAIRERTDALSAGSWIYHPSSPWRCRISLNTGAALMGTLGGTRARDFTVLGDAVNVAFRLNDLAGKIDQDIVISAETARLIEGEFVVDPLGCTPLEGRSGTVEIYRLLGPTC
jgi:adenylate cyclase